MKAGDLVEAQSLYCRVSWSIPTSSLGVFRSLELEAQYAGSPSPGRQERAREHIS